MVLKVFNELKNSFVAVCQLRMERVKDNVGIWNWTCYLLFLAREKSRITPSGCFFSSFLSSFFFLNDSFSKRVNNLLLDLNEWQQLPLTAKGRESGSSLAFPRMPQDLCWTQNYVVLLT